ncbi:hypothetical protein [Moorena sp. SIO3H5]|uniref:hypothetical protein n=1 Tax=Moorena sp. SIO3H5 TaxID=2607834 RepID=UPI0013B6F55E|nr:hypothetical protein [Moorena sp. SIO3H5]NEO70995.1 hypothetical protein [Moorena sp. SIO3H5]
MKLSRSPVCLEGGADRVFRGLVNGIVAALLIVALGGATLVLYFKTRFPVGFSVAKSKIFEVRPRSRPASALPKGATQGRVAGPKESSQSREFN